MTASHLVELVYRPLREQFSAIETKGNVVRLTPRFTGVQIDSIKHPLIAAARMEGGQVVLQLSDRDRAMELTLDSAIIDTGPYEQESLEGDVLRLRRRSGDGPEL